MELTYPIAVYIGVGITLVILALTVWNSRKYKGGKKSANTEFVRSLPQYKFMMAEYHILRVLTVVSLVTAILLSVFLVGKPIEVKTTTVEKHNRDIMICLDISGSLDEVSTDLCEELKDFVSGLEGERFGITIFNARAILLVPLTDDYAYVIDCLDRLEESIECGQDAFFYSDLDSVYLYGYRFAGTLAEYYSSLIGDGLASALYNFPDLDEAPERSRMIMFVTDNDLQGVPIVTVDQACDLCANRDVKVFALAPDFIVQESAFKESIEKTGGEYFNTRDRHAMDDILELIQETDQNVTYSKVTTVSDEPEPAMFGLLISIMVYTICARRLRL